MLKLRMFVMATAGCWMVSAVSAATLTEDFSVDPLQRGWQSFGVASLFQWDSTNHNLAVTWDSSKTNSYFYHSLGTILTTNDAFSLDFDLQLRQAEAASYGSELAVGFLQLSDATSAAFLRTSGTSPNVAEFDYFPPSLGEPSIDATLIDRSNNFYFRYATAPLNVGQTYHIRLSHGAGGTTLSGEVLTNGQPYTTLTNIYGATSADFRLDVVALASYQDDGFGDTLLAQGTVDNLVVTLPPPPVQSFTGVFSNGFWQGQFMSQSNWIYTLERTTDFRVWAATSVATPGNGATVVLQDASPANRAVFYRVRAERP
ncbi:MAG TPA: hypothetical protein VNZ64_07545 [Candidatus Acidoferrum sp.]|nr:hypothetical protein [Candidatus Acidoferrum sp.]